MLDRYRRIAQYPLRSMRGWGLILFLTLLTTVSGLLAPIPMKVLVDQVFGAVPAAGVLGTIIEKMPGGSTPTGLLFWVALSGLLIFLINSTLDIVLTFSWVRVGQKMVYDLMCDVFAHVQRTSLKFHTSRSVGDLMGRVAVDPWSLYSLVESILFTPLHSIVTISAMFFVMMQIDVQMALISILVAPVMALVSVVFGSRIRRASHLKREAESRMQSHVQQTLSGLSVVQAFGQEEREAARFGSFARAAISAQKRSVLTSGGYNLITGGVNSLGAGVILYIGARSVIGSQMTIGGLLVFLAYLSTLQTKFKALFGVFPTWQTAGAGIDRINEMFDAAPEFAQQTKNRTDFPGVREKIEFENVSFAYGEIPVLSEIDLEVRAGETVAIVGTTGAGKSTLVSLLPRFYEPQAGRILIDGLDIREIVLSELRANIAFVLQEPFLFPLSIAENIAFGKPGASIREIEEAARKANAHDFITKLPDGYDTILGERGSTLSGGEQQRISIARAFLKSAPILILDEPTSSLDTRTEMSLLDALDRLMKVTTTFVIAHRLSTVRNADNILVLEKGKIVEMGRHEELLAHDHAYASLYRTQFGTSQVRDIAA